MHAAVVTEFDRPPRYEEFPDPVATREHEVVVTVEAAGLHPRVRSQSAGSHYTSTDELPLVPGIDGVGRMPDGTLRYFVLPDTVLGSLAERTLIDERRSIPLPDTADVVTLAAAMNPAMSSWIALTERVAFAPGQSVLVLGANGSAGQLAIQVARHFGASRVIAAGRDAAKLAALHADGTIVLGEDMSVAANVDIVLDYLWGAPAANAMIPLLTARDDRTQLLSWVQIGAIAGAEAPIPSAALRQANVHVLGSGQGSVRTAKIVAALPELARQIDGGALRLDVVTRPLRDIEKVWGEPADARVVITPN